MVLHWVDWSIIAIFLLFSVLINLKFKSLGESGLEGFFLGGRNLPWYLAGLSMVATTFAADTPLAVTELVAQGGIAKNWLWWNMLAGGLLTAIFFTRLWRRSGVLTEVEFINIRYSGRAAKFLRSFKAVYLGLIINAVVIAWVNLAFMSLVEVFFGITGAKLYLITGLAMLIVYAYSSISGLKGIAVTDAFQFIIAMIGCIVLAVLVLQSDKIGGISGLKSKLDSSAFQFFPTIKNEMSKSAIVDNEKIFTISVASFFTMAGVLWWSTWYPGAEPGGGGYIAQRMMSAKDEKNSFFATLFFQIAHYCLRPWPWILVALCALVLYPDLPAADQKLGYVMAMKDYLPTGLKGLLLVAFLGAYMSTISTQLNWGASYLVNDFYLPVRQASRNSESNELDSNIVKQKEQNLIRVSRMATLLVVVFSLIITTQVKTISGVWEFIMQCGSGLGLVLILRWFWHRINVWSEITATITPFFVYGFVLIKQNIFKNDFLLSHSQAELDAFLSSGVADIPLYFDFANGVLLSVSITTVCWLVVTFLTRPTDHKVLSKFYEKVQPTGAWGGFGQPNNSLLIWSALAWVSSIVMVYSCLFCSGKFIFMEWQQGFQFLATAIIGFVGFVFFAKKAKLFA
ncbi:MAG: Na+:solute symporter [Flavobacteriales bacterium]|nr:Na+:solute symporter [Flavobacteriales bacterium]